MAKLKLKDVKNYIEENIGSFHESRQNGLSQLKLSKLLLQKNPYLFKAKNILTAESFVKNLANAYISSQEETMFGAFLERLAIFVCKKVYGGKKSSSEGLDLEFEKDGVIYVVAVKSGTNWGNSSQIARMKENFRKAKQRLRTNAKKMPVEAINGCCYGRVTKTDKGEYYKIAGQKFWKFISDIDELYTEIIEPLAYKAKERNQEYELEYARQINIFSQQFANEFCIDGIINWKKIVQYNSGENRIKVKL
ncbi:conserved putative cytosolic protein [hydrocarbon metagenome]|uniref:Conserved putative cytosolic protein n=1 Tax=hydrocarbon metagenome TaxID=938273 RepID=A0A0W8FWK7_9ZZZZ